MSVAPPVAARRRALSLRTFNSLRDRNFRWFFASMFVGFTANSMQMFMSGWLVFELTQSYLALGVMSIANGTSNVVLGLTGGVLADRMRRKKILIQLVQATSATLALVVGLLIVGGVLRVEHVIVATAALAGLYGLTMPSRQSLTPEVVGMDRLTNAQGLYVSGQNLARLLMPGVAGWIVGAFGPGEGIGGSEYTYLLMASLYLAAAALLIPLQVRVRASRSAGGAPIGELVDGFRYVLRTPAMLALLSYNAYVALFAMTIMVLLPGFAKEVLEVDIGALGLLTSVLGVGAMVGSLIVASLPNRRRGVIWLLSVAFLGCALIAFATTTAFWLALVLIALVGVGQGGHISLSTVLVQTYAEDSHRGRVLSIYHTEYGLMAYGVFLITLLADVAGPQAAVALCGIALLVLTVPMLLFAERYQALD